MKPAEATARTHNAAIDQPTFFIGSSPEKPNALPSLVQRSTHLAFVQANAGLAAGRSGEMSPEFRLFLQVCSFLGQDLGGAFRREAQLDEGRPDIGDLAILRDLAVAELHHRYALEANPLAIGLGQLRDVAERVIGVEHLAVAHR